MRDQEGRREIEEQLEEARQQDDERMEAWERDALRGWEAALAWSEIEQQSWRP